MHEPRTGAFGDTPAQPLPYRVLLVFSPVEIDGSFEEAALERVPLQGEPPEDPDVLARLGAFTEGYGYEFAELPAVPKGRPRGPSL